MSPPNFNISNEKNLSIHPSIRPSIHLHNRNSSLLKALLPNQHTRAKHQKTCTQIKFWSLASLSFYCLSSFTPFNCTNSMVLPTHPSTIEQQQEEEEKSSDTYEMRDEGPFVCWSAVGHDTCRAMEMRQTEIEENGGWAGW